jgi:hypothetical protein
MQKECHMKTHDMQVILGSFTIKAYVTAPKYLTVIGIVRMGMEYGLLALSSVGQYLRVNGSQWSYLNQQEVLLALQAAKGRRYPTPMRWQGTSQKLAPL